MHLKLTLNVKYKIVVNLKRKKQLKLSSLTCIGFSNKISTIIDELKQFINVQNDDGQSEYDEGCQWTHVNRLCVLDEHFGFVKCVLEIANHEQANYQKSHANRPIESIRLIWQTRCDACNSELLLDHLENLGFWWLRLGSFLSRVFHCYLWLVLRWLQSNVLIKS